MTKKKIRELVSAIVVVLLFLAVAGLVVGLTSSETKNISSFTFTRGYLDPNTGEFVKSDTMLCTEEAFKCQGLNIEADFTSNAEFEVYYYREDQSFIGKTSTLKGSYSKGLTFPNAAYARILLKPVLDDDKIALWDINKYAKQLTVSVSKDQTFEAPTISAFSTVREDYIRDVEGTSYYATRIGDGPFALAGEHLTALENRTVKEISIPVAGVADYTKDSIFSVYVIEGDGTKAFKKISEYELVIPAYTFSANIASTDPNDNEVTNGAEAGWYTFDVNIKLGDNQTLAFSDAEDTVYSIYRKSFTEETCKYPLYNLVTGGSFRTVMYSIEIYYDVKYLE